jgi:hypothetical protein
MSDILIIKDASNDFEVFCSNSMRNAGADVAAPYSPLANRFHYTCAVCKRLHNHMLYGFWLDDWKKKLKDYKKIIVFDNCVSEVLLKWLSLEVEKSKIIVWFWNIPEKPYEYMKKYARIFIFDEAYAKKHELNYSHQFYFDDVECCQKEITKDLVYIGKDKKRYKILRDICEYSQRNDITYEIDLFNGKDFGVKEYNINYIDKLMSYGEVIERSSSAKAIIELVLEEQKGLTLRALEALFMNKKLITNNAGISKFEFYNPNNIFVLNGENLEGLSDFLNKPLEEVPGEIKLKYSFADWLKSITTA